MMRHCDGVGAPWQDNGQRWGNLFTANLNSLFELALLFTADPHIAEVSLASAIDTIDISSQPDCGSLRNAVAIHSIRNTGIDSSTEMIKACSMIRSALRPILHLERSPRICFVLRVMTGYATSACAGILGVDENAVILLFQTAILQLSGAAVMAQTAQEDAERLAEGGLLAMTLNRTNGKSRKAG
jgi:hypothetical protein